MTSLIKFLLIIWLSMGAATTVLGQYLTQKQVSGKLSAADGRPYPNAFVYIKGETMGTGSNANGEFRLDVPIDGTTLVISYGRKQIEVALGNATFFNIQLMSNSPKGKTLWKVVKQIGSDMGKVIEFAEETAIAAGPEILAAQQQYQQQAQQIENQPSISPTMSPVTAALNPSSTTIADFDGNRYKSILINNQVWLTENLKTTHLNDGTPIKYLKGSDYSPPERPEYSWYDDDKINADQYGALYGLLAARSQKLCPVGWHVPTHKDFESLLEFLGGSQNAGLSLMVKEWAGNNKVGFSAVASGSRGGEKYYFGGSSAHLWSSTPSSDAEKSNWYLYINMFGNVVLKEDGSIGYQSGYSVRCIANAGTVVNTATSNGDNLLVTGRVVAQNGIPYANAVVRLVDGADQVVTNENGEYKILVSKNGRLQISTLGNGSVVVDVGGRAVIDVKLPR